MHRAMHHAIHRAVHRAPHHALHRALRPMHCTPCTAPCTDHQVLSTLLLFGHALYADLAQLITALPPALGWMVAPPSETPQRAQKVYMRWLNIQPMRVLLSCRSVAGGNGFEVVYGDHVHGEAAMGVLNSASAMVANIDRASIRLKALVLDNVFTPMPTLLAMIGASYKEQLLLQVYKLLFSFEVRSVPPRCVPPLSMRLPPASSGPCPLPPLPRRTPCPHRHAAPPPLTRSWATRAASSTEWPPA